ncbi:MAG: hypothetical protein U0575_15615 [Phycisphaerales bacterium]
MPVPRNVIWRFFVDTGGTFTDCSAIDPRGAFTGAKVLMVRGCARTAPWTSWNERASC